MKRVFADTLYCSQNRHARIEYTSRKGDTYILQAGQTRTGKPRWWFGRKLTGTPVEVLPAGYEIYESPGGGQVFLRKIKHQAVGAEERELVAQGVRRYAGLEHFAVNIEGNALVVYLPDTDGSSLDRLPARWGPLAFAAVREMKEESCRRSHYSKMMRFVLVDERRRRFEVQRWVFRGAERWMHVGGRAPPCRKWLAGISRT